jgi:hypothetical protein
MWTFNIDTNQQILIRKELLNYFANFSAPKILDGKVL